MSAESKNPSELAEHKRILAEAERRYAQAEERIRPGELTREARNELNDAYLAYLKARRSNRPNLLQQLRRLITKE